MSHTQLMVINQALHGSDSKSLASKFTSGRFDKDMKWAAERSFATQIIQSNEQLQQCTPESIQVAMLDVAYSGLSLSPSLAHGYLIAYGQTCTFRPGYRGLIYLANKSGVVTHVQAALVHQNDPEFRVWTDDLGRHITHEESRGNRGKVTHAYCVANLTTGGKLVEVMDRQQLDSVEAWARRPRKPGGKAGGMVWAGPWKSEMRKKAVIRRGSKFWPKDSGGIIQHMMQISDRHDPMAFAPDHDENPPEAELCMNLDHNTELHDLLVNRGIAPESAPEWLRRWAQSKGYADIEHTPARLFEEAKETLNKRLDERGATTRDSTVPPDNQ